MAKCNEYICDICGRHVNSQDNHQFKVKRINEIAEYGRSLRVNEKWDICVDCLTEIRTKVRNMEE